MDLIFNERKMLLLTNNQFDQALIIVYFGYDFKFDIYGIPYSGIS